MSNLNMATKEDVQKLQQGLAQLTKRLDQAGIFKPPDANIARQSEPPCLYQHDSTSRNHEQGPAQRCSRDIFRLLCSANEKEVKCELHVMSDEPVDRKFTFRSSQLEDGFTKQSNACILGEKDVVEYFKERLKKEREEKEIKKKKEVEAHLYTIIKVARDEDLKNQIGRDIYFDLVDHDKVRSFRIKKLMPFNHFKREVAKELGIPVEFQRYWLWAKRNNQTYRPHRPLTAKEETLLVGELREETNKLDNAKLKLFLEVELGLDLKPIAPPGKTKDDILIFFKLYVPEKKELRYVGRLFVKDTGKPEEIIAKLNEMAGYPPDEEIDLYEEIKFEPDLMCIPVDREETFQSSMLEDGDIICFQKRFVEEGETSVKNNQICSIISGAQSAEYEKCQCGNHIQIWRKR